MSFNNSWFCLSFSFLSFKISSALSLWVWTWQPIINRSIVSVSTLQELIFSAIILKEFERDGQKVSERWAQRCDWLSRSIHLQLWAFDSSLSGFNFKSLVSAWRLHHSVSPARSWISVSYSLLFSVSCRLLLFLSFSFLGHAFSFKRWITCRRFEFLFLRDNNRHLSLDSQISLLPLGFSPAYL